ncbi:MAG: UDP-N-acetylmuramate dehydrogenase [Candidatus Omnitrophica bacterium]|nr:UDP-N-acetylmuramate dehydrogenase [Candidatus Omnitrophota bacterium]
MDYSLLQQQNISYRVSARLADYTTFRLGGPCRCLIFCATPEELKTAFSLFTPASETLLVIGGGSNIVVADQGVDAIVIRYATETPRIQRNGTRVSVSAATYLDELVSYAAQQGLSGLNFASGIPGTVGGAVAGNAGAFGRQIGDAVGSAVVLRPDSQTRQISREVMGFAYRDSIFKKSRDIILTVDFNLSPEDPRILQKERADILNLRREKHPDWRQIPSAGSFFRNIEPSSQAGRRQSAGWFLEQAGAKELNINGGRAFAKHANILIKAPQTTAQDIHDLSLRLQDLVVKKFKLKLEREVLFVGQFKGKPPTAGLLW